MKAGVDGKFATDDDEAGTLGADALTHAKIASIKITGRALGTVGGTDAFGFASEEIGSVSVGGVAFKLVSGANNDNETLPTEDVALLRVGSTGDFRIRELKS